MSKRTLALCLILGVALVAIVSAQQPQRRGEAAFKPLPASTLGTLRQPVKDIPKATGKWTTAWVRDRSMQRSRCCSTKVKRFTPSIVRNATRQTVAAWLVKDWPFGRPLYAPLLG